MSRLQGSKTLSNLMAAFAGESQARTRYDLYAEIAYNEGHQYIHSIFEETAKNEIAHAKMFFDYLTNDLKNGTFPVNTEYPIGMFHTMENLLYAAAGEQDEATNVYPAFAKIADEEGFKDIANTFKMISEIEAHHEARFMQFADDIKNGMLYKKDQKVYWKCLNCGHVHEATNAPSLCPVCKHPQGFFYVVQNPVMG
ncbi:rubrerythrin [Cellulosilyticum sp. I15G10I2]|uniref:rubrerythrin n=1 Tax=Cellulosilyticum sp. I15G10I2 TaxID=1892843 RepID=UPI00085C242B|nr:rubrerythrin family protein [Cellulosilyticum sp. I15G10I2]